MTFCNKLFNNNDDDDDEDEDDDVFITPDN